MRLSHKPRAICRGLAGILSYVSLVYSLNAADNFENLGMFSYYPSRGQMVCHELPANEIKVLGEKGDKNAEKLFGDYRRFMEQNEFKLSEFGTWRKEMKTNSLSRLFISEHKRFMDGLYDYLRQLSSTPAPITSSTTNSAY